MNNTQKQIMENLADALSYKDCSLDEGEKKLLNKVISSHLESFKTWKLQDYMDFASTVISENLRYALREYDLLSPANLDLPSAVEVPLDYLDVEDIEGALNDWLAEKFNYCTDGFNFIIKEEKGVVIVTDIEWDISWLIFYFDI